MESRLGEQNMDGRYFAGNEYLEDFHYCEIYDEFPIIKPDDICKNWKRKRLTLIGVTKNLFGL